MIGLHDDYVVYTACFFAALCAASWGFDAGISSSILHRLQLEGGGVELSDTQVEIFVGAMSFFSIPGALFAYVIADAWGRLKTFVVSALGLTLGIAVTICSTSFELMILGRAIMGVGAGFAVSVDTLYIVSSRRRETERLLYD